MQGLAGVEMDHILLLAKTGPKGAGHPPRTPTKNSTNASKLNFSSFRSAAYKFTVFIVETGRIERLPRTVSTNRTLSYNHHVARQNSSSAEHDLQVQTSAYLSFCNVAACAHLWAKKWEPSLHLDKPPVHLPEDLVWRTGRKYP